MINKQNIEKFMLKTIRYLKKILERRHEKYELFNRKEIF